MSRNKPRLDAALKRGASFRVLAEDDLKWLWAAYRKGAMTGILPDGLRPETFTAAIMEKLVAWNEAWLLFARDTDKPLGFVVGRTDDHYNLEVHARWFPWASPRNIIETALRFLTDMGRDLNLLVFSEPKHRQFFIHLCRYGVLMKAGFIRRYFRNGEPATLFQTRKAPRKVKPKTPKER